MARLNEPPVSTDSIETRAQRIADHALEIKAKMEAQLIEWGAMLAGLGMERPTKRQAIASPGGTRIARRRTSVSRSPVARRRPRDSRSSEEAAALLEGRMPTIQENKSFPRKTMSHDEILSISYETADTNESPDLGPPPTSRFVEDDPVKVDSPTKSTGLVESNLKIKEQALPPTAALSQPVLEPKKKPSATLETGSHDDIKPAKATDTQTRPSVKAGSKRKFGDENDDDQIFRAFASSERANNKPASEKPLAVRDLKSRRSVKDPSVKFDGKDADAAAKPRKPLADKSTNDDLISPKKLVKSATTGDLKKVMLEADKEAPLKTAPLKKKRLVPIKLSMPPPPAPSVVKIPQEPETPSADPGHVYPDTPETRSAPDNPRDTPPPADISSYGETSRPSRRARASVSYAEPNLRDKMRRPTKELLDAVSGEGKYRRSSMAQTGFSASASKVQAEHENPGPSSQLLTVEAAIAEEAARRPIVTSPLLQREPLKEASPADLPSSVVTERRRRPSSRQSQLFEEFDVGQSSKLGEGSVEEKQEVDPYEFQDTSSSVIEPPKETTGRGRSVKGVRRSTAVDTLSRTESSRSSRKRASMAPPTKPSMFDEPDDADSSYEASVEATKESASLLKDKVSRRRSMML
ncbi:Shugoshin [Cytospora mali]|uniref:Shugoshin n=1 Tax=Cytospora mali TaxID=578113 RepID=A0A194V4A0_CYTMA|nr:Shugoshin [Valsa mali var. pyri (nom. inval.)]